MPLIETKGAASAQGFGEFAKTGVANYIEDVFSTYLYTGNGSTQTITNGIDLSTKGGMVWAKCRSAVGNHILVDTNRGIDYELNSNNTSASSAIGNFSSFNSNGFTLSVGSTINALNAANTSWTFRKQPKFFDVVTYTGTGANRTVAHNLGSVPGCIITKRTDTTGNWITYHRSLGNTDFVNLNTTAATSADSGAWNNTTPTSTEFSLGTGNTNVNGGTYVAYLFAHNAGGFGLTGTDNVISCGSFTTDGSGNATVTLGYEPQFVIAKASSAIAEWKLLDTMRGWVATAAGNALIRPNTTAAEITGQSDIGSPTATGIAVSGLSASTTYIYITIRRGPMKTPTSGTSVFSPQYATFSGSTVTDTGFVVDLTISKSGVATGSSNWAIDRLRGAGNSVVSSQQATLQTNNTSAEIASSGRVALTGTVTIQNGFLQQTTTANSIVWAFRRAPGFFDVVCYTGDGQTGRAINHNLGVAPELLIVKTRTANIGGFYDAWVVGAPAVTGTQALQLASDSGVVSVNSWSATQTASTFVIGTDTRANNYSAMNYVAYLFASCPGVSKVGSYTGTGALQTINCGFTGGARFVLIKRTDSTGDWYVYDSARGISSGNDPYLLMNSDAAEVTGTNYVDTTSVGFQVTAAAPAGLNANGGTFLFLAVA